MPVNHENIIVKTSDTLYDAKSKTFYVALSRVTDDLSAPDVINLINNKTGAIRVFKKQTAYVTNGYYLYRHAASDYHGYAMRAFTFDEEMKADWKEHRKNQAESVLIDILADTMKTEIDDKIIAAMQSRNGSEINE